MLHEIESCTTQGRFRACRFFWEPRVERQECSFWGTGFSPLRKRWKHVFSSHSEARKHPTSISSSLVAIRKKKLFSLVLCQVPSFPLLQEGEKETQKKSFISFKSPFFWPRQLNMQSTLCAWPETLTFPANKIFLPLSRVEWKFWQTLSPPYPNLLRGKWNYPSDLGSMKPIFSGTYFLMPRFLRV